MKDTEEVCVAYIFFEDKILLTKHIRKNMWLPVGGHQKTGETDRETLVSEVKEETNLNIKFYEDPKNTHPIIPGQEKSLIREYIGYVENISNLELDKTELSDYKWVTPEIQRIEVHPKIKHKVSLAKEHRDSFL